MHFLIFIVVLVQAVFAAPQERPPAPQITHKDGNFSVDFFGFKAQAGLNGLFNGNGLGGGMSASASTPMGQQARAGLGGTAGGKVAGSLYADAQANPSVGASSFLGGSVGEFGIMGSESHAYNNRIGRTWTLTPNGNTAVQDAVPAGLYDMIRQMNPQG